MSDTRISVTLVLPHGYVALLTGFIADYVVILRHQSNQRRIAGLFDLADSATRDAERLLVVWETVNAQFSTQVSE